MTILRVRVTVLGAAPSAGPFILAANHLSYLDVIVLAALVPTVFVAKSEVRGWPIWGTLAWAVGTIFVDRASARDTQRVGGAIERELERGGGVTLFPEGTSTAGKDVAPFRSSLLDAAVRTGTPVHYVGLSYGTAPNDPPAHLSVCWWGDMEFAPHFGRLCGLERIDMRVHFGDQPLREADRKTLAAALHQAVTEHFTPVVTEVA
jgi:1-acyl-sn-glycerol-3-phosphate acyltransferase